MRCLLAGLATLFVSAWADGAHAEPVIWRLDCGEIVVSDLDDYSDTFHYAGRSGTLTVSCYLVRSGDRYLLWDTGLPGDLASRSVEQDGMRLGLRRTIGDQLAEIGVTPEQIDFVALSHYHFDHTGQARHFPSATLLVGALDWDAVRARPDRAEPLLHWTQGGGRVIASAGDHDVFGDGEVVMIATPGHTPGHRALLVRLAHRGAVLLSGDLYHLSENRRNRGVPGFNTSRAETLASMDRFERMARNLDATVVLQHEPRDVSKLPAFPRFAD